MYLFKIEDDKIKKYQVSFLEEELQNIKLEIINNCSEIVPRKYTGTTCKDDFLKVRNLRRVYIGRSESRDELQYLSEDLYEFSYDEYIFPKLVENIDALLNLDINAVNEIFTPTVADQSISTRIELLKREIDQIDNLEVERKIDKLKELKQLTILLEINKNQKPVSEYYSKVQKLITMDLVDSIELKELNRINEFFDDNLSKVKELVKKSK